MQLDFDDACEWIEEQRGALTTEDFVASMVEAAAAMAPGATGRAAFLGAAGEAVTDTDPARALDLRRQAVADGGWSILDPRAEVADVLLHLGRADEADALLTELRTQPGEQRSTVALPTRTGEILEMHARLPEAERWYTIGLRAFDPSFDEPDLDEDMCLAGRYRVRRARGRGLDAFDRWFEGDAPDAAAAIREWTAAQTAAQTAPSERQ